VTKSLISFIASSLLLFSVSAWPASTKEEIIELKAQVAEMQKDLAEIKKMLQQGARAEGAQKGGFSPQTVSIGESPVKGDPKAPVTIIEYSDYQCPFCARNYRDVMPILQEEYIDTGKVKFVMREYPLATIHGNAQNAAMAALCAGDQGKYWDMHNVMFENQNQLDVDSLKGFAGTLGLDTSAFNECLDSKAKNKVVQADMASAAKLGMRGTPGFFIGRTDPDDPDKVKLTVYLKGAQPINKFREPVDQLLAEGE
jgi:protein-disulfide isomerase